MKTLHGMALRSFLPMVFFALLFFVLILQLVDVFTYIWRYIGQDVPLLDIARVQLLYLPKCVSYALSPSLLFAVSFTLGTLYGNNELISVFGAGVSLYRFVVPFILTGLLVSVGGFYFEEHVVIETYRMKNSLTEDLLQQRTSLSNTNITVVGGEGNTLIYNVEYYNDVAKILQRVLIIERDTDGAVVRRIDAEQAVWRDDRWRLQNVRLFEWDENREFFVERGFDAFTRPDINEAPETFRKTVRNIGEMTISEAERWIEGLRRAGLPYREPLTELYRRYSFAVTPLIVALISCSIGGRFKKNILLMSLLLSLIISVLYYVSQMVTGLMAKMGVLTPLMGAWLPFIVFFVTALWLFKGART